MEMILKSKFRAGSSRKEQAKVIYKSIGGQCYVGASLKAIQKAQLI